MTLLIGGRRRGTPPSGGSYTIEPFHLIADGPAESRHYGFPGFAILPNGDFYAVARRAIEHNPTTDPATYGKIVGFKSTDQGQTWTTGAVVQEDAARDLRDPTLALLSDGRLALLYFSYLLTGAVDVMVSYSSDGGATWTAASALPRFASRWTACSGPIVEPEPGHLFAFGYTEVPELRMFESTDNGATWTTSATLTGFAYGMQEPYPNIRQDGRIEVHLRDVYVNAQTATLRHRVIRNADGTWTTPEVFAEWASGRPMWVTNPTTGHRLATDRKDSHSWIVTPTDDAVATDPTPWTWFGPYGSQYEQAVAQGTGFVGALAMRPPGEGVYSSLYWTRWDLTTT